MLEQLPKTDKTSSAPNALTKLDTLEQLTLDIVFNNKDKNDSDNDEEIVKDDQEEKYISFLKPYGQVLLDPDLDLEPQVIAQESSSPDYSEVYDSFGNIVQDDYPSSWDDEKDAQEVPTTIKVGNEDPWSDIGQEVNSSFEFWKAKNKLKALKKPKLYDTKYEHNNKYASDSNINDAVDMTEPGLRKIFKPDIYDTTTTSSEMTKADYDEHIYEDVEDAENIYEDVDNENLEENPESGFFSYVLESPSKNVTCIAINQEKSSSSSEEASCKVTVNGKLWISPVKSTNNCEQTNDIPVLLNQPTDH